MKSASLFCIWLPVHRIRLFELSTQRKWGFCFYFSSIHVYWPPNTWNSLVHDSWSEMEKCEKSAFYEHQLKHKKQVRNWHFLVLSLQVWKIIHFIMGWGHKSQTVILILIKILRIWIFFSLNVVIKHKNFDSS